MGTKKKPRKPVVWQDIIPATKPNPKHPIIIGIQRLGKRAATYIARAQLYDKLTRLIAAIPFKIRLATAALCFIAIIMLNSGTLQKTTNTDTVSQQPGASLAPVLVKGNPKFTTISPAGKGIKELGGWTRVSPSNADPVFAYVDHIGNTQISVSEQPLPASFKQNTAERIAELAHNFSANEKITAKDTTVYIGISANGQQSVILSKAKLLILIKSTAPITNDQWVSYIDSLH